MTIVGDPRRIVASPGARDTAFARRLVVMCYRINSGRFFENARMIRQRDIMEEADFAIGKQPALIGLAIAIKQRNPTIMITPEQLYGASISAMTMPSSTITG